MEQTRSSHFKQWFVHRAFGENAKFYKAGWQKDFQDVAMIQAELEDLNR